MTTAEQELFSWIKTQPKVFIEEELPEDLKTHFYYVSDETYYHYRVSRQEAVDKFKEIEEKYGVKV